MSFQCAPSTRWGQLPLSPAILIVDDDPPTRETLGRILRLCGIRVYEADTGGAAVRAARIHPVDLAIIDFRLPDVSGLDVVRNCRSTSKL